MHRLRSLVTTVTTVGAVALLTVLSAVPAGATSPTLQATGSSFADPAIVTWVTNTNEIYGLNVNWEVQSSVVGLNDFQANQLDFAASDIPYITPQSANQANGYPTIPYQYLPDVAGGLSFMYNLQGVSGQLITSLNLNAQLAAQIFLGKISYWDDSRIAAVNPQLQGDLPHTRIVPVYRTDASGENYLLSDYLLHQDGAEFTAAQQAFEVANPGQPSATWPVPSSSVNQGSPSFTSTYPNWPTTVGQTGSSSAASYVASAASNGSITYVETSYAVSHQLPVASLHNASGNYVQPTELNVSTALEAAILHPDLTQDLTNVYVNGLANAYPLSAYSYLVTPCVPALAAAEGGAAECASNAGTPTFPASKGQALGQFVAYLACAGQSTLPRGYAPLPPNLVDEDYAAIGRLNGASKYPAPTPGNCKNPYVDGQTPLPGEPCIVGQPCHSVPIGSTTTTGPGSSTTGAGGGGGGGGAGGTGGTGGSGTTGGTGGRGGSTTVGLTAQQIKEGLRVVDGHVVRGIDAEGTAFTRADRLLAATEGLGSIPWFQEVAWTVLAVAALVGIPVLAVRRRRRTATTGGAA